MSPRAGGAGAPSANLGWGLGTRSSRYQARGAAISAARPAPRLVMGAVPVWPPLQVPRGLGPTLGGPARREAALPAAGAGSSEVHAVGECRQGPARGAALGRTTRGRLAGFLACGLLWAPGARRGLGATLLRQAGAVLARWAQGLSLYWVESTAERVAAPLNRRRPSLLARRRRRTAPPPAPPLATAAPRSSSSNSRSSTQA